MEATARLGCGRRASDRPRASWPGDGLRRSRPTPTDALFVLGRALNGDAEASRRGLLPIAEQLGITLEEAACRVFDLSCEKIITAAGKMIDGINSKPVYTVRELLSSYKVEPVKSWCSAARRLLRFPPRKAHGPSGKRRSPMGRGQRYRSGPGQEASEVTLFADTERGIAWLPRKNSAARSARISTGKTQSPSPLTFFGKNVRKPALRNRSWKWRSSKIFNSIWFGIFIPPGGTFG